MDDLISRQAVIDVLSQYPFEKVVNCISIIEEFPSAQPERDIQEIIYKQDAIDALKEHRALYCDNTPNSFSKLSYAEKSRVDELDTAIATLVNLPSAQPEGKKGVFIPDITVKMLRKASLEAVEDLLTSGEMKDIVLPSAQSYTEEQIQKMQDMEQAQLEEAYRRGYEEGQSGIIRCRDCKEYCTHDHRCRWWNHGTQETGWCSYAERREG